MSVITREAIAAQSKPYISYAMEQGKPETLTVSSHTSHKAADTAALKRSRELPNGSRMWGWFEVTESDKKYGHVI